MPHPRGRRAGPPRGLGPEPYVENLSLMEGAAVVLTDSGGMQEESAALGVRCVTMRETRPSGRSRWRSGRADSSGTTRPGSGRRSRTRSTAAGPPPPAIPLWDGQAGERIAGAARGVGRRPVTSRAAGSGPGKPAARGMARRFWRHPAWPVAAVGATAGILVGTLLPATEMPDFTEAPYDRWLHVVAFAAWAFTGRRAGLGRRWTLGLGIGLALLTEAAQGILPLGRSCDPIDGLADLAGTLVGLAGAGLFPPRAPRLPGAPPPPGAPSAPRTPRASPPPRPPAPPAPLLPPAPPLPAEPAPATRAPGGGPRG